MAVLLHCSKQPLISGFVRNHHFNPTLQSQSIITTNAPPLLSNATRVYPANEWKLLIIIILGTHIVHFSSAGVVFGSLFIITQEILKQKDGDHSDNTPL